jgi:hypothetical protein
LHIRDVKGSLLATTICCDENLRKPPLEKKTKRRMEELKDNLEIKH